MKLVCGVGINDASYQVRRKECVLVDGKKKWRSVWICPYYSRWQSMLGRCYSPKVQEKRPTYIGCSVCEEWKYFSNFKAWMEKQDWEGKQLDKDLLVDGNKEYGPETCCFISKQVNLFLVECGASRGKYPIGVHWNKGVRRFMSQCCNPITKKNEPLGYFDDIDDAHKAWLARKLELAIELAKNIKEDKISNALVERYKNYQLI